MGYIFMIQAFTIVFYMVITIFSLTIVVWFK